MALGALFVLSEFWITALAPPERRGLVMGVYATVLALGFATGPAVLAGVGTSGWPPYLHRRGDHRASRPCPSSSRGAACRSLSMRRQSLSLLMFSPFRS